jgi:hypothetical protein
MAHNGFPSYFRLGEPYTAGASDAHGDSGVCEPHVSLFMLAVAPSDVTDVVHAVRGVARTLPLLDAVGEEYRHNPHGAPEVYFARSPAWVSLQHAVIDAVEPLRRGRLREVGPSGERLPEVMTRQPPSDPIAAAQLARYGYDEVTDADGDRFNPHVTLAWPDDPNSRISLAQLPPAQVYSCVLSEIAVYGMSPYGTCTTEYAAFSLDAQYQPTPTGS